MEDTDSTNGIEKAEGGFQSFEHAAADIVLAASFNSSGTRVVLCSADHKLRVYKVDPFSAWNLMDQWRGHDAEVLDVQWFASCLGQLFATIGGDNKFKLWREDPTQQVRSGRRFRCIFSQSAPNHVSYVSFGSKVLIQDVYLALFTHDGLLSLFEPMDLEMLNSWNQVDAIYPFDRHSRCTEARFRLSFHQGEGPSPNALFAGLDPKAISLAVSAMNVIKICRAVKSNDASEGNYQLHEMIMMHIEDTLINEIAWAPGCLHPYDLIAAACDDGTVRILEVDTHYELGGSSRILVPERLQRAPPLASRNTPSGIGAGLAGLSYNASRLEVPNSLNIKHQWRQVAELAHNEAPVWKVRWTHDGSALATTGDNGKVNVWRKDLSGDYIEFAETVPV